MTSSAPRYKLPKGKPVWLLVRSDKPRDGAAMDAAFNSLKIRFNGRVRFITLNWGDKAAKSAIDEFSLDEPPSSVLADVNGRVVEKFEGVMSAGEMTAKLNALVKNR